MTNPVILDCHLEATCHILEVGCHLCEPGGDMGSPIILPFAEMLVWSLTSPLSGSHHYFKYRLALVVNGRCVLRYDNESGKGDHKHIGDEEFTYIFTTPKALLDDFWDDVDIWRP